MILLLFLLLSIAFSSTIGSKVDGGWSPWGPYSECSKSCGVGFATRSRKCTSPEPKGNGKGCSGSDMQVKVCKTDTCPDTPQIKLETICEKGQQILRCYGNKRIHITTAFWGRADNGICKRFGNIGKCSSRTILQRVKTMCNGKHQCNIVAKKKHLGNPGCWIWVKLYFQTTYMCIEPPRPSTTPVTTTTTTMTSTSTTRKPVVKFVEVCQSRLVFCDEADEIITKIRAVYTNRISALCSALQAQAAQSQCKNDITFYINETCYNQAFCVVQVIKTLHGFGCQGNGHIEMSYECKSKGTKPVTTISTTTVKPTTVSKILKRQICEFRSSFVSCSPGQILDIKYAFFGRKDGRVCKHGNNWDTSCSTDAMKLVQYHCQNKQFCFVNADAGQFGDPCPSTTKYLEFEYECIPKGTVTAATEMFIPSVPLVTRQPYQTQNPAFRQCGMSHVASSRVIGGTTPVKGKFPWQVAIYRKNSFSCGGSLISPTLIITAAHCLNDKNPANYYVILGEHDRTKIEGSEERYDIEEVTVHREYGKDYYSSVQHDNDIAVMKLKQPVFFNKFVSPVCLPDHDYTFGEKCFVSGWGKATFPGKMNGILQHAELQIVDTKVCREKLKVAPGKPGNGITDNMFCVGDPTLKSSGCHGDSGGPFVCRNINGEWVLRGVVSWGSPRCNMKDMFMVLTNVIQYRDWINWFLNKEVPKTTAPTVSKTTTQLPDATTPSPKTTTQLSDTTILASNTTKKLSKTTTPSSETTTLLSDTTTTGSKTTMQFSEKITTVSQITTVKTALSEVSKDTTTSVPASTSVLQTTVSTNQATILVSETLAPTSNRTTPRPQTTKIISKTGVLLSQTTAALSNKTAGPASEATTKPKTTGSATPTNIVSTINLTSASLTERANMNTVRVCGVLLVYCELPGYTITNIKAAYTNRITDQCSNSSIQNSEITCFNNITALLNARCLGQLVCVVEVNSTLHASGCQRSGYIEMSYECKPQGATKPVTTVPVTNINPTTVSRIIKRQVCEERSSIVACSPGEIMNIRKAFFGRKDSSVCRYGNFTYTNCSTDAMEFIKFYCQNKQLCFINAQAGQYGDPCPSITKYLEFEYECVPKGTATVATELLIPSVPLATRQLHQTQSPVFQRCGVSYAQESRVTKGTTPTKGRFPWQAAIYRKNRFSCGASLISPTLIITAAHCFNDKNPDNYYVILGEHDRAVIEGSEERYDVAEVIVHYKYGNDFYSTVQHDNDVALLRLKQPVFFNKFMSPVCLPEDDYTVGEKCFVSGWGKTKFPGKMNRVLQHAELPIVNSTLCREKLISAPGRPGNQITSNMFCAGALSSTSSGCHGDSGGPFVCVNRNGQWIMRGIISWGSPRCSMKDMYLVLTNVIQYRDWIKWYLNSE